MRVWRRFKANKKTQEDMALALGISQQSVSDLLKGSYRPGYKPAMMLANLDGKKLDELLDDWADPGEVKAGAAEAVLPKDFPNLDVCIKFYTATKKWSPWTIAAARAGFFGRTDFDGPEWVAKLDLLEKALERTRKTSV